MGYNRASKSISFFFIFLPLFFSERTPVRSGQPHRGSFTRRVAADNACASWCIIVSPLGIARYLSRSVIRWGQPAGRTANALHSWCIVVTPLGLLGIVPPLSSQGDSVPCVGGTAFRVWATPVLRQYTAFAFYSS